LTFSEKLLFSKFLRLQKIRKSAFLQRLSRIGKPPVLKSFADFSCGLFSTAQNKLKNYSGDY